MKKLILPLLIVTVLFASGCAATVRTPPPDYDYERYPPRTVIVKVTEHPGRLITVCTGDVCHSRRLPGPRVLTKTYVYTAYWYEDLGGYYYRDNAGGLHRAD